LNKEHALHQIKDEFLNFVPEMERGASGYVIDEIVSIHEEYKKYSADNNPGLSFDSWLLGALIQERSKNEA